MHRRHKPINDPAHFSGQILEDKPVYPHFLTDGESNYTAF